MIDPHATHYAIALTKIREAAEVLLTISKEKRISGDQNGAATAIRFCDQLIQVVNPQVGFGLRHHCENLAKDAV